MARTLLQTRISLDTIRCHEEGDGIFNSAEPYLWTVFFKVDGDRTSVGDDYHLQGECEIFTTDGSHGNLGVDNVDAGDDVVIPPAIGELRTTLRPIPLSPLLQQRHPEEDARGGVMGVVFVLMEENLVSDHGARAGYAALCDFVKREVDRLIPTFTIYNEDIDDATLNGKFDQAMETIREAIADVQDGSEDFWSYINGDESRGFRVLHFRHDELANNYWDINERLITRTPEGHLRGDWQILGEAQGVDADARGYTHVRRSADVGAPPAIGAPTTCLQPSGAQSIVYRATSGHLHELWRDAVGQIGTGDLTAAAGAPPSASNPFAYLQTTTGTQIVVFQAAFGGVSSLYWSTGPVGLDNLSTVAGAPAAAGAVAATFNPANHLHHIASRDAAGHLHVIYSAGGTDPAHYDGPLTIDQLGAPLAAGDPAMYFDGSGQNIVVYRGTDSNVHSIYWSTGPSGHDALSEVAGTPAAAGDPVAYFLPQGGVNQVTYRGADGHIWELYWRGVEPVAAWNVTAGARAPLATSDPAVYYSAGTNRKHVVYLGPFGHLFDVSWVPGQAPTCVDLTLEARAARAVDRPAVLTVDAADTHYVVYRGTDHQIHEIHWVDTSWDRTSLMGDWRWCSKCEGMFYGPFVEASRCPDGGTHAASGTFSYLLPYNVPGRVSAQGDWRWCNKCQGLFYGGGVAISRCPAGGTHTPPAQSGSSNYHLPFGVQGAQNTQNDWRWCNKCQGLFYGGGVLTSQCPADGTHTPPAQTGSYDYVMPYTWTPIIVRI